MKIVFATRSEPKVREVRQILGENPGLESVELLGLSDLAVAWTPEEEGIEVFDSFEENAVAKARWFAAKLGVWALADDSGLEVEALDGQPGVWSRRYCPAEARHPEEGEAEANNRYLLERLSGVRQQERRAQFVCVAALSSPADSRVRTERGTVQGEILNQPVGSEGFGYDPLFRAVPSGLHFGSASREAKSRLSHRGAAFRKMVPHLLAILESAEGGQGD